MPKRVFIVHAHPGPESMNGALTLRAEEVLAGAGHQVVVSDLYAMGFDPVSDRRNFTSVKDPAVFKQQVEEMHAAATGGFAPAVQAEMDKLFACDALILQFPLWARKRTIATFGQPPHPAQRRRSSSETDSVRSIRRRS